MHRAEQGSLFDDGYQYATFEEKFKPKKTTDDCYTPTPVYEAIADYVSQQYSVRKSDFVRPFYPGGNYETLPYETTDIVVDNPPFSILSKIVRFYNERRIRFFLFAPHLTLFTNVSEETCGIVVGIGIVYENGAVVNTSFLTNMDRMLIRTAPELYQRIKQANKSNAKEMPKYRHAKNVLTVSMLEPIVRNGIRFDIKREDAEKARTIDSMREIGKAIFGCGFIISDKTAAAKEAAAKEAAAKEAAAKEHTFELSERERAIVNRLNGKEITHERSKDIKLF